ncbi:ABC transporter substrate-binding protein [Bifidobacterium animalis subsp. animalis MCC 1489]|nr:ABC transporter substrate-binding protein [Bifidobacterium animalis subsp. animalis ATCC 27672]KOA62690.1 ABC transporter substrate-binding protein [Bifidobacterium animalis subsp. animalis MCC 1489]
MHCTLCIPGAVQRMAGGCIGTARRSMRTLMRHIAPIRFTSAMTNPMRHMGMPICTRTRRIMSRSTMLRFTPAACAALLALSCSACGEPNAADSSTTMRVAYLSTANYLTTVRGEDFLDETMQHTNVKFTGPYNPTDAYSAVLSGNADATSTGTGSYINFVAQGQPWVAFAIEYYTGDSQGIVASPKSGVNSLEDLYGRNVAIIKRGGTGDYVLHKAFEHAGLDVDRVNIVEMSPSNFQAAFTSGQIDALSSFDQNLAAAMATPSAKLLVNATEYGNKNVSIHLVSKDFATKHPEAVKAMYRALVRESDAAQATPSIITDAYREFGASDDVTEQIAKFNVPVIKPIDAEGLKMLESQAQEYVDFGFIDAMPDLQAASMDCSA